MTQQNIYIAYLMLILLRAFSVPDDSASSAGENGGVASGWVGMDEVKAQLAQFGAQRGWEDGAAMGWKAVFFAKGKRACRIDFKTKRVACAE